MPTQTKDESTATADTAIEVAIASVLSANNAFNRVDALRLLTKRIVRMNRINRVRPRLASENSGAL